MKNLNGVKVRLNSLDDINHYAFYFETIHLPWPSKELRLKSKEKEPAAPNLSKEVQLGSHCNDHYSLNGENTPLLRRPEKKKNAGSGCLCCTIL